ncbi:TPA: hypothetical protein UM349_000373 [Stenotrophomonas maltophilia]|nr:hypothetical protein [Stenotrophomonas maltophilia]
MIHDQHSSHVAALPPPMTVGRYVRTEFPRLARYITSAMALSLPVILAIRIKDYGFSWKLVAAAAGGLLAATLIACIALAIILPIAGWWKLHTKISPFVPVTIALIATIAILAYRVS